MTQEEKDIIKQEEIYREEVRKSLTQKTAAGSKFIKLINSSLFIWFLSTIVIGLFTYYYQQNNETQKAVLQRETRIKQLDLEIEFRISQFWTHLSPLVDKTPKNLLDYKFIPDFKTDTLKFLWEAFKNQPSLNPKLSTSIYNDFNDRTTVSLMIELSTILEDKYDLHLEQKSSGRFLTYNRELSKSDSNDLKQIVNIHNAALFITNDELFDSKINTSIPVEIWKPFKERIINRRWNKHFPLTSTLFNWHPDTSDL